LPKAANHIKEALAPGPAKFAPKQHWKKATKEVGLLASRRSLLPKGFPGQGGLDKARDNSSGQTRHGPKNATQKGAPSLGRGFLALLIHLYLLPLALFIHEALLANGLLLGDSLLEVGLADLVGLALESAGDQVRLLCPAHAAGPSVKRLSETEHLLLEPRSHLLLEETHRLVPEFLSERLS
jgi:hypothetical protein